MSEKKSTTAAVVAESKVSHPKAVHSAAKPLKVRPKEKTVTAELATGSAGIEKKRRRPRRKRASGFNGTGISREEINATGYAIPSLPVKLFLKRTIDSLVGPNTQMRVSEAAVRAIHDALEDKAVEMFSKANMVRCLESDRQTLMKRDMMTVEMLDPNDPPAMDPDTYNYLLGARTPAQPHPIIKTPDVVMADVVPPKKPKVKATEPHKEKEKEMEAEMTTENASAEEVSTN